MKSPFTGGEATLHHEVAYLTYRKEKYSFVRSYYKCEDTHVQFSVEGMDDANVAQVYNQYRVRYGIPFADEIRSIREGYGLSAAKMSLVLGFGDNQYRLYEGGEMPSLSNGRLLNCIRKASFFRQFVVAAKEQLGEKDYETIMKTVAEREIEQEKGDWLSSIVFDNRQRCADNGYAVMNVSKLKNIILYFIEHCSSVFNTKMNKLLFYLDMLAYRESGYGMSGLAYKAIKYGPVPVRWDRVYSMLDGIDQEIVSFDGGIQGLVLTSAETVDMSWFSEREKAWLDLVATRFDGTSASGISDISHQEDAWLKAYKEGTLIDFEDAFTLRAL